MFKKFKDKLAEEVKSSPQRIQQFAQAAQAAVTSASSSISDITNNELFSIGDNDSLHKSKNSLINEQQQNSFREVPLVQQGERQLNKDLHYQINQEMDQENQRQRRLSNSSFTSDISFRLPSYESPSMYHLQSDMEVSASEAEEKGFSGGTVNLDRVTKEQLYSAYRRTQDRCTKYKTQYADLARHYKLLERENAKARNVLVETQDKALRRISELKEQCSLEQSAKAHLEKVLNLEIEEKNMKIHSLNTTLSLLQENISDSATVDNDKKQVIPMITNDRNDNETPLISLATDDVNTERKTSEDSLILETVNINNKIEKMEQLLNKYKESLKASKEKNAQLTSELQIISNELDTKVKENDQLKGTTDTLTEARKKIQELNDTIEDLQNKNNSYEFAKHKEISLLELSLKSAQEEITQLREKTEILSKREEEYAISLAENKLSIHKELESKESEIKSLKDSLELKQNEVQSLNIIINDYKNKTSQLEEDNFKLKNDINELNSDIAKLEKLEAEFPVLTQKYQSLEQIKNKAEEEYSCLQLQMKQETAEKLAMIDRNIYLENRNSQLIEENSRKSSQINNLESEMHVLKNNIDTLNTYGVQETDEVKKHIEEIKVWKSKCNSLESEIQEERIELGKLQSEIEKLLENHESVQKWNEQLNVTVEDLKSQNTYLRNKVVQADKIKKTCDDLRTKIVPLRKGLQMAREESKSLKQFFNSTINILNENINLLLEATKKEIAASAKTSEDLHLANMSLQIDIQKITDQKRSLSSDLHQARQDIDKLKSKIKEINSEKNLQTQIVQELNNQNHTTLTQLNNLMHDYDKLNKKMQQCEEVNNEIRENYSILEIQNKKLLDASKNVEKENNLSKENINMMSNRYEEVLHKYNKLKEELEILQSIKEDYQIKKNLILELEKRTEDLNEENISLKHLSQTITKNVTDIETELKEVRKSHLQIEKEKEHLNSIINDLEKNSQALKVLDTKDTQTEFDEILHTQDNIIKLNKDITLLNEVNDRLTKQNEQYKIEVDKSEDLVTKNQVINKEFDLLKEENKRLQSDINGLQSHLAKVSKENSQLNDKMREMIALNESFPEKSEITMVDVESLRSEIQSEKEKIDNLIRENSLLAEENLELKDQIKSQSYFQTNTTESKNLNNENILEKYNKLLEIKNKLQMRLNDLELINQSVNGNMQQIQTNNDKLKLSNEKLERRLDEALVSLRHLHSLQENTELEYLRNILYEYLTGSGTHSITLAKVLAAVVKFDDRQTELVLQKEKERQGLLRQLGII